MINRVLIFIMVSTLVSCDNFRSLETRELVDTNPTEHVFNISSDSLKRTILKSFNEHKALSSEFYKTSLFYYNIDTGGTNLKMFVSFNAETAKDAIFGKDHFKNPGTVNDIYLHSFGTYWYSPVYFAGGRALETRTPFILTLEKVDKDQTMLKVRPETPSVIKGVEGLTAHGFYSKEIPVKPTTVEEYSLILFIAEQLGDTTLAPLNIKTLD